MHNAPESRRTGTSAPHASDRPARRGRGGRFGSVRVRVLIPLSLALAALLGGFGWVSYANLKSKSGEKCRELRVSIARALTDELRREGGTIEAALEGISQDRELRASMQAGDTKALYQRAKPLFDRIREKNKITHFYFFSPDRVCLLRVHQPDRRGDKIDRITAKQAARTGKTAWGLELGPMGTITYRVVRPCYDGDRLIGYIEMGSEIEHVIKHLSDGFGVESGVLIDKERLDKATWTEGMLMLGRQANWRRFPSRVVASCTMPNVPAVLDAAGECSEASCDQCGVETTLSGRDYAVCSIDIIDAAGDDVGDMVFLRDLTGDHASFYQTMSFSVGVSLLIGVVLFVAFYFYLGRVDKVLNRHADRLARANEELEIEVSNRANAESELQGVRDHLRVILEAIPDPFMVIDTDYRIVLANETVRKMAGENDPVLSGMRCHQVSHCSETPCDGLDDPCPLQQVRATGAPMTVTHTHHDSQGVESKVEITAAPIFDQDGDVMQIVEVCRDVTESKRTEAQLHDTVSDLERFNRLAVGREERMMELKREVNEIARKAGLDPPYDMLLIGALK